MADQLLIYQILKFVKCKTQDVFIYQNFGCKSGLMFSNVTPIFQSVAVIGQNHYRLQMVHISNLKVH